jgi:hypothetical protein
MLVTQKVLVGCTPLTSLLRPLGYIKVSVESQASLGLFAFIDQDGQSKMLSLLKPFDMFSGHPPAIQLFYYSEIFNLLFQKPPS